MRVLIRIALPTLSAPMVFNAVATRINNWVLDLLPMMTLARRIEARTASNSNLGRYDARVKQPLEKLQDSRTYKDLYIDLYNT